jgi:DNA polymerase-3 subunit epsilon
VIEAIQSVAPLRRCTARLGRNYVPSPNASPCTAAQLGVAECPCSGSSDPVRYAAAVDMVVRGLRDEPDVLLSPLRERMLRLATSRRFEEAAGVRDRAQALSGALKRQRMIDHLRRACELDLRIGNVYFEFDHGRLLTSREEGTLAIGLPLPPPPPAPLDAPLPRRAADETLCIARYLEANGHRVELLRCSGEWVHSVTTIASFEPQRKSAA